MKPLLIATWTIVVVAGLSVLGSYQGQRGRTGQAPLAYPSNASFIPAHNQFNLILSLHPHCPCSSATVEELSKILAHTGASMRVHILMFAPAGADANWTQTSLSDMAGRLPNTEIAVDVDGKQAKRLGALTSGDTQLYAPAPDGRLLFHGGITSARGHAGDNAGADAIIAFVNGAPARTSETPVFGCEIQVLDK